MIDANEMVSRHDQGNTELVSLLPQEQEILQHYCSILTDGILQAASQRGATADQAVINGIRAGIALGLQLRIERGEVKGR